MSAQVGQARLAYGAACAPGPWFETRRCAALLTMTEQFGQALGAARPAIPTWRSRAAAVACRRKSGTHPPSTFDTQGGAPPGAARLGMAETTVGAVARPQSSFQDVLVVSFGHALTHW